MFSDLLASPYLLFSMAPACCLAGEGGVISLHSLPHLSTSSLPPDGKNVAIVLYYAHPLARWHFEIDPYFGPLRPSRRLCGVDRLSY